MTFNFGKYKGCSLDFVLKHNPAYVRWCVKNVSWFKLPEEVKLPPPQRRIIWAEQGAFGEDWDDFDCHWDYLGGNEFDW